jgi:hypothetical protein
MACVLRHEREAHGLHGHGEKPYLCSYKDCERSIQGNGFPRHWNLKDHMKRVHSDSGDSLDTVPAGPSSGSSAGAGAGLSQPAKGRKRKSKETSTGPSSSRKSLTKPKVAHEPVQVKEEPVVHMHASEWEEHYKALMRATKTLRQDDMDAHMAIREAQDRLEQLARLSRPTASRRSQVTSRSLPERTAGKRHSG